MNKKIKQDNSQKLIDQQHTPSPFFDRNKILKIQIFIPIKREARTV